MQMAENHGSKDKSLEVLDFIINVLKEHEQNLDRSIDQLATVTEQIGDPEKLEAKLENAEDKLNNLIKEASSIIGNLSKATTETIRTTVKEQELQSEKTSFLTSVKAQSEITLNLNCKTWEDFQTFAVHARTLTFTFDESSRIFQVNALKGKQMLTYAGTLPNFSLIFKAWLSHQFDVSEINIIEGLLDRPR